MTIPQVKNPLVGAAIIFVGLPLLKLGAMYYAGTINHWSDMNWAQISDLTFHSFWAGVFWVFFRSPWAAQITKLTSEAESIGPDGTKTTAMKSLTVEQSPAPAAPPKAL